MKKKKPYLKKTYTEKEVINSVNEYREIALNNDVMRGSKRKNKKKRERTYLNHRVEEVLDARRLLNSCKKAGDDWEIKIPEIKNHA